MYVTVVKRASPARFLLADNTRDEKMTSTTMIARQNRREVFIAPHPDDAEVMLGHRIAQSPGALVVVASDGEASTVDHVGGGFVSQGKRRIESVRGLEYMGVERNWQIYLSLPDGEIKQQSDKMRDALLEIFSNFAISSVITLGEDGYDGHDDHIYSHQVAVESVLQLDPGTRPNIYALNSQHKGEYLVYGDALRKLGAMSLHPSQFNLQAPEFWRSFAQYTPLIWGPETYDRLILPQGDYA